MTTITDEKIPALRSKYDAVRATARKAERIVDEIVDEYSSDLDAFVTRVEEVLDIMRDKRTDVTDRELQAMVLRLPVLLYRFSSLLDRSALESDIAKAAAKIMHAQCYNDADGTIRDKDSTAILAVAEQAQVVDLAKHVYSKLKAKYDIAMSLFDGIRKVMTNRDNDKQAFRRDK